MPFHSHPALRFRPLIQLTIVLQFQVGHAVALGTIEMGVLHGLSIIALYWEMEEFQLPLLRQQLQVPVHRPSAQVGVVRQQPSVDHVRCGMFGSASHTVVDQLSLTGIAALYHISPLTVMILD